MANPIRVRCVPHTQKNIDLLCNYISCGVEKLDIIYLDA